MNFVVKKWYQREAYKANYSDKEHVKEILVCSSSRPRGFI